MFANNQNLEYYPNMLVSINKNICIWQKYNPIELSIEDLSANSSDYSEKMLAKLGFQELYISIKDNWFRTIPMGELQQCRNKEDGYYRVVYIQINTATGEYYIGKANRPKWSEIKRYQGSGLKFVNKFNNHKNEFVRYFIASCKTAKETEELEVFLVDKELLADEKCLNLIAGGGGINEHPTIAETCEKKRQYMIAHPEQYKPMVEKAKMLFQSGNTPELKARSERIKEVMNSDKYREMTRERIHKWIIENPEEYVIARENNKKSIRTKECSEKKKASLEEWKKKNPDKYKEWQEKLIKSRTSKEANAKRANSIKIWNLNNPEQAEINSQKRARAAAEKNGKAICMLDLETGEVIQEFANQHDAARWLVENGKAKNTKCVSSISAVCLKKYIKGHGHRKQTHGYGWCFAENINKKG